MCPQYAQESYIGLVGAYAGGRGAYPQGKHPHQSCHGGQEEGGDDRNKGKTVVDARATIVWDGTSTRVFSETL